MIDRPGNENAAAGTPETAAAPSPPVAVVVGAGPAGILTAVGLARAGLDVHVYERHPSPLVADSSDKHRAFVVMLHPRGRRALSEAGFDVSAFGGADLQPVQSMAFGAGSTLDTWSTSFPEPRLVGSRHAFCRSMVAQVEGMGLNISWHFETSFESLDLERKTALFCSEKGHGGSGSSSPRGHVPRGGVTEQRYDLLVAADGGWSRLRRAAERQAPQLRSSMEQATARYKVFEGLPAADGFATNQMRALAASGAGGFRHAAVAFVLADPASGACRGVLSMDEHAWNGLECAADFECLISQQFPSLPAAWRAPLAAQLEQRPLAVSGMRVHASQLHGPSLLLVGDAGHGVTPRTGNGMNAALEDAWLISQLLKESGGDLASLPEAFTKACLSDAQALLWLDANAAARRGTSAWGRLHPAALLSGASMVGRGMLSKATRGYVRPGSLQLMNEGCAPYADVKRQIERDRLLLSTVGAPLTATFALLTTVAAVAGRLRG